MPTRRLGGVRVKIGREGGEMEKKTVEIFGKDT